MVPTPRTARPMAAMIQAFFFKGCSSHNGYGMRLCADLVQRGSSWRELRGRRVSVSPRPRLEHALDFLQHFFHRVARLLHAAEHQAHFRVLQNPFLEVGLEPGVEALEVRVRATDRLELASDALEQLLRGPAAVELDVGKMGGGNADGEREPAQGGARLRSQPADLLP